MSLHANQYSLFSDSLFTDDTDTDQGDAFYNDYSAIARSTMTLANLDDLPRSAFALIDDRFLAALTEEARQSAEDMPVPPSVCPNPDCRDTFTAAYYRPGTAERVWSCGTPTCENSKGVAL